MFERLYGDIGIKDLSLILKPKMQATRNFHGHYYLDSDKLENFVHFQRDSMEYYYDCYIKDLGATAPMAKVMCKVPGGEKLMATVMGNMFNKLADGEHGTKHFIDCNMEDRIEAYWGSRKLGRLCRKTTTTSTTSLIGISRLFSTTAMTNQSRKASLRLTI